MVPPITHTRKDQNLFILDLATSRKVIQVNNTQVIMTIKQRRSIDLVSNMKKISFAIEDLNA